MILLYKQELFKLLKRKSTLICLILLVVQNVFMAIMSKMYHQYINPQAFFGDDYGSVSFIYFIMIASSASIIASEFEYNTIKNLIAQSFSRKQILISKWLAIFSYSMITFLLVILVSVINKIAFFNNDFSLFSRIDNGGRLVWQFMLVNNVIRFITLWLILSAVFLFAATLKKSAVAIVVGLVGYFALSIIGKFMFMAIEKWDFLKWNPLNFLSYADQVDSTGIIAELTHLTNLEMLCGSISYIILFLTLGMYFFSKKEV